MAWQYVWFCSAGVSLQTSGLSSCGARSRGAAFESHTGLAIDEDWWVCCGIGAPAASLLAALGSPWGFPAVTGLQVNTGPEPRLEAPAHNVNAALGRAMHGPAERRSP